MTTQAVTRDELSLYSQRLRALEIDLAIVKTLAETVTDNLRWWNRFIIGALILNIIIPVALRFAFP